MTKKAQHAKWTARSTAEAEFRTALAVVEFAMESPDLMDTFRKKLVDSVLWLVTEGTVGQKYETRFRSRKALDEKVNLRHEHVFTRKDLKDRIFGSKATGPGAKTPEERRSIAKQMLLEAVACTVTRDEHKALGLYDKTHQGWERYIQAKIEVIDRATGEVADLRALAKRSQAMMARGE